MGFGLTQAAGVRDAWITGSITARALINGDDEKPPILIFSDNYNGNRVFQPIQGDEPINVVGPFTQGDKLRFTITDANLGNSGISRANIYWDGSLLKTVGFTGDLPIEKTFEWDLTDDNGNYLDGVYEDLKICGVDEPGNEGSDFKTYIPTVEKNECYKFTLTVFARDEEPSVTARCSEDNEEVTITWNPVKYATNYMVLLNSYPFDTRQCQYKSNNPSQYPKGEVGWFCNENNQYMDSCLNGDCVDQAHKVDITVENYTNMTPISRTYDIKTGVEYSYDVQWNYEEREDGRLFKEPWKPYDYWMNGGFTYTASDLTFVCGEKEEICRDEREIVSLDSRQITTGGRQLVCENKPNISIIDENKATIRFENYPCTSHNDICCAGYTLEYRNNSAWYLSSETLDVFGEGNPADRIIRNNYDGTFNFDVEDSGKGTGDGLKDYKVTGSAETVTICE